MQFWPMVGRNFNKPIFKSLNALGVACGGNLLIIFFSCFVIPDILGNIKCTLWVALSVDFSMDFPHPSDHRLLSWKPDWETRTSILVFHSLQLHLIVMWVLNGLLLNTWHWCYSFKLIDALQSRLETCTIAVYPLLLQ